MTNRRFIVLNAVTVAFAANLWSCTRSQTTSAPEIAISPTEMALDAQPPLLDTTPFASAAAPTTAPAVASASPELPVGHPVIPQGASVKPQSLPAGHPAIPEKASVGPVDPAKVAGRPLPAGHPQINPRTPAVTSGQATSPADPTKPDACCPEDGKPSPDGSSAPTLPAKPVGQLAATEGPQATSPAAQNGTLEIRVIQGTPNAAPITSGTPILEVYDGDKLVAKMETPLESDGHIRVYDIPLQTRITPRVKMSYAGIEYEVVGEPMSSSNPSQDLSLTVYEITEQQPDWQIRMRHVMLQPAGTSIQVSEVLVVDNPSDRTFVGTADPAGNRTVFRLPMPDGASDVEVLSGFHACCMRFEDGSIVNPIALLPGQAQYQISYSLPLKQGAAAMTLASPVETRNVAVLIPDDGSAVEANGLDTIGSNDMGSGTKVRLYKASDVAAGAELGIKLSNIVPLKDAPVASIVTPTSGAQQFALRGGAVLAVLGGIYAMTRRAPKSVTASAKLQPAAR